MCDFQADVDIVAFDDADGDSERDTGESSGVFNPVEGTTKITGTFTMNSDANGTARIATLGRCGSNVRRRSATSPLSGM